MYSQVVEVPKYIVEGEKTTTTGIDRHIPVWPLVEQDWAGARERMRALCPETGSREQTRQASSRIDGAYPECVL
jgi:hypothetical protein